MATKLVAGKPEEVKQEHPTHVWTQSYGAKVVVHAKNYGVHSGLEFRICEITTDGVAINPNLPPELGIAINRNGNAETWNLG